MGGEEVEAEGVDHSFRKFGRESPERKGSGARGGSRVKQRFSGRETRAGEAGGKAERPAGIRAPSAPRTCLVRQLKGRRQTCSLRPPRGVPAQGCRRKRPRPSQELGRRKPVEGCLGTEPRQPSGARPGARGQGE